MQKKSVFTRVSNKGARLVCLWVLCVWMAGCAGMSQSSAPSTPKGPDESALNSPPRQFSGLSPVAPQPSPSQLQPGLAVHFHRNYNSRTINALTDGFLQDRAGISGAPVPQLDHQFDRGTPIYDSGRNIFLAVRMQGLIRLPESGKYTIRVLSNDGVRLYVGDQMIVDDARFGSDRYAVPAELSIITPGWYSLQVEFFQRQGSAALKASWRTPGSKSFVVIPAEAFAHTGSEFRAAGD